MLDLAKRAVITHLFLGQQRNMAVPVEYCRLFWHCFHRWDRPRRLLWLATQRCLKINTAKQLEIICLATSHPCCRYHLQSFFSRWSLLILQDVMPASVKHSSVALMQQLFYALQVLTYQRFKLNVVVLKHLYSEIWTFRCSGEFSQYANATSKKKITSLKAN